MNTPRRLLFIIICSVVTMAFLYFVLLGVMAYQMGDTSEAFKSFDRAGIGLLGYLTGVLTKTSSQSATADIAVATEEPKQ